MDFSQALHIKTDEVERPPLLPIGNYVWQVTKHPEVRKNKDQTQDIVTFPLRCVQPTDDVDPKELKTYGDVTKAFQRKTFWFDLEDEVAFQKALWQMKNFCNRTLKIEGATIQELLANSVNAQCIGAVIWKPDDKDSSIIYENLGDTAPLD